MIEERIEELAVTINELTSSLNILIKMAQKNQYNAQPPTEESDVAPTTSTEKTSTEKKAESITKDMLKSEFMRVNRLDKANKPKLKAWLKSFGANRIDDLTDESVTDAYYKIVINEWEQY